MEIWAHRGRTSPNQIGNSYQDFLYAESLGITGFETDICLTRDGKVIIYHPKSTEPDLSKMLSKNIRDSIFNVMYLNQFLILLKSMPNIKCCLDIKQYSVQLVREVVKGITEHGLEDKIYITAFQRHMNYPPFYIESDGKLLLLAKRMNPDIRTHLIVTWPFNLLKIYDKYKPDVISFGWLQEPSIIRLTSRNIFKTLSLIVNLNQQIKEMKFKRVKVWAGILNRPEEMLYFDDLGVNGIMTDEPKILMDLIKNQRI